MANATASVPSWDIEDIRQYTTPGHLAGFVAWEILTHQRAAVHDLTLLKNLPTPEGLEQDDVWSCLYELVNDAGRIGYLASKIDAGAFALPWEKGEVTTERFARAMAALMGIEVDENGVDGLHEAAGGDAA